MHKRSLEIKVMEFDPQNVRYEIKMDCDRTYLPVIKSWVIVNSAGFREAFPPRQVNSLYFDTNDMDSLNVTKGPALMS